MDEKNFYIDFDGWCVIRAKDAGEAVRKFLETTQKPCEEASEYHYDFYEVEEQF